MTGLTIVPGLVLGTGLGYIQYLGSNGLQISLPSTWVLLMEDGISRILLEDGVSKIDLETYLASSKYLLWSGINLQWNTNSLLWYLYPDDLIWGGVPLNWGGVDLIWEFEPGTTLWNTTALLWGGTSITWN